jgi:hypothetical protein
LREVTVSGILIRAGDVGAGFIAVDLVTLHVFDSRPEAERAQDFLTSKGIISYVLADDCGGFRPYLGFTTGGFKLQTHRNDCETARDYLHNIMDLP